MNKKICYLLGITIAISSTSIMAYSDAEIEKRFQYYEEKIQALEKKIKSGVVDKKLKKQVKRNKKKVSRMADALSAEKERVQINGFMTVGAAKADDELGTGYIFNDRINFRGDSKLGMQFDYKLSETTSATVQLVARSRSEDTWRVDAEWAYISHDITDWASTRVGRLRIPFYLYSESLDVGLSYPWVRPPIDLYTTLITSFDGIDFVFKANTGPINHRMQIWAAAQRGADNGNLQQIDIYDSYGINITSNWNAITARLATTKIKLEGTQTLEFTDIIPFANLPAIAAATGASSVNCITPYILDPTQSTCSQWGLGFDILDTIHYHSAALQYDDGNLLLLYEGAVLKISEDTVFGDDRSNSFTAAYRVASWTPYATMGRSKSEASAVGPQTKRKSRSFGLRYSLNDSTAVTVEWNHFYDMQGSGGFNASAIGAGDTDLDDTNVYSIVVDAVF
ncbi:hypothetical protein A9Q81_14325 [Gammaproteobacteria bacterium 42_54_T18]|nr:hypothetical protein A9Q81_14325 [Gammaproteobacteria bacterium 42_54_T18]